MGHSAQCTNTNSVCVSVVQVFPFTHLWLMHAKAPIGQLPAKPAGWGGKIWGLGGRQLGLGASKHKSKYNLPQACKSKYAGPHVVKYGSARAVHYMLTPPLVIDSRNQNGLIDPSRITACAAKVVIVIDKVKLLNYNIDVTKITPYVKVTL